MTSTILDTRQYRVGRRFLYQCAKEVITGQGWAILEDIDDALIALIRGVDGLKETSLTVTISGNQILVKCGPGCRTEDHQQNQAAVNRFFRALEESLNPVIKHKGK